MRDEFDAYHVSGRKRWTVTQGPTGESGVAVTIVVARLISGSRARRYDLEQASAFGESSFAAPVAEEPVVTDTLQSARQHVKQEAADELRRAELHHALGGFMAVVFPAERDVSIGHVDQAIVRDGDPMRVTPQVVEYLLQAAERFLCVHHPFRASRAIQITGERLPVLQGREGVEEPQAPGLKGMPQSLEEQTPEQA